MMLVLAMFMLLFGVTAEVADVYVAVGVTVTYGDIGNGTADVHDIVVVVVAVWCC